jgi:hypothetical protein
MKQEPKGMPAFDDPDPLPGQRMPWEARARAWVLETDPDWKPDEERVIPGEDEEDGTEMPTPDVDEPETAELEASELPE